jgi:DNA primase
MQPNQIKEYIVENNLIRQILESLGCHSIKLHSDYYTFGNPDGDNKQSVSLYLPSLNVVNYTRSLPVPSDIFTLIEFYKDLNFFHALKWLHEILNLDFYSEIEVDLPESIRITRMLFAMRNKESNYEEDDTPIKILPPEIKKYYPIIVNDLFLNDGVSYSTQIEFELSYENESNRVVFPVYTEVNDLASYKGRLFKQEVEEGEQKYLYLYPCPKSKILFGLNKTYPYIKEKGKTLITESEKGVMQLWSMGHRNCIGLGGKKVSKTQVEKITRLGTDVYFALDKDVQQKELEEIASKFIDGVNIYAIYDKDNILKEKQSPSDDPLKWDYLIKNNIYKIK